MGKTGIRKIREQTTIDKETGEVLSISTIKEFSVKTTVDSFYMTFIDYASPFLQLKQGSDKTVIAKLCTQAEFNTGVITLAASKRKDLCDELNISNQQLTNSLLRLKKLKLIEGGGGVFKINPLIFWKGDLKSRDELLNTEGFKVTFNFIKE